MNILTIDTSGQVAGVAIARDDNVLCEIICNVGLTHSETVQPAIDRALTMAGMTISDVDRFACVAGPGSFTGVRIGVCIVKALAHATGRPVVALNALNVLAWQCQGFPGVVCSMLDARRDQVYAGAFVWRDAMPEEILPNDACALDTFLARLPEGPVLFTGDGARKHEAHLRAWRPDAQVLPEPLCEIRPGAACALAMRAQETINYPALRPIYLRKPQAERERLAKEDIHA